MEPSGPRHRFAELSEQIRAFQQSLQNVKNHPTKKDLVEHLRTAKDLVDKVELFIEKDRASLGEIRRHLISAHQTESSCLCHAVEELLERSKVLQQCLQAVRSFLGRERNALSAVRKNLTSSNQPQRRASSADESSENGANAVGAPLSVKQMLSFAGGRSASTTALTPVDVRTPVGPAFAVKPPRPSAFGEELPTSSSAAPASASNLVASIAKAGVRNTPVNDSAGKHMSNETTNEAFIDHIGMLLNNPAFAVHFRNTRAALRSVDLSLVNPTQLLNAVELNARAFQHSDSQELEQRLQAKSASKRPLSNAVLAQPQLQCVQLELCLRAHFRFQNRASNVAEGGVHGVTAVGASVQPKLSVDGSSHAATSAPNPMETQFPSGDALAPKPAAEAIIPLRADTSISSSAAPAKKSRWCNMHVALAHSIANNQSSAAADHRQPQPRAVGALPSVQPSPVTGSSSTATSAPNPRELQLPAGDALSEKPADAAIIPFVEEPSTSSGAAPAKPSDCAQRIADIWRDAHAVDVLPVIIKR